MNLTLSDNAYVAKDKIAPNRSATATLVVNLTGTEVATDIVVSLSSVSGLPNGMTITGVTANGTSLTESSGSYSTPLSIPVTVTAKQHIA